MTRQLTIASCDGCGGPVCFGAPFCPYCRTPLEWTDRPSVSPGEVLHAIDFRRDALPKGSPGTRTSHGLEVRPAASSFLHGVVTRPLRNACVTLRGTVMDGATNLGLLVRMTEEDSVRTAYEVRVYPALRSFQVRRLAWHTKLTHEAELRRWEHAAVLAPPGSPNQLELRYADSVFEVWLNGKHVATFLDAGFGYGAIAWKSGTLRPVQGHVVLESIVVRRAQ